MYVCLCNGYKDSDIRRATREGGVSCADDAYLALGNDFCCGSCRDCAQNIVNEELEDHMLLAAE